MFKSSKPSRDLEFLAFVPSAIIFIYGHTSSLRQDLESQIRRMDRIIHSHHADTVENTAKIKKLDNRFLTENKSLKEQLVAVEQQLEAAQKQLATTHAHITALNARTNRLEEELKRAIEER